MAVRSDYSDLADIKTSKQKKEEQREKIVKEDIANIEKAIKSNDEGQMRMVHMTIDGKYATYIPNFGQSMYNYSAQYGFDYNYFGMDSLKHNLTLMQAKLEGYLCDFPEMTASTAPQSNVSVNVPITNNNEISINISYEAAKQTIEDMPGLTDQETDEIKSKIDDLENISREQISKKKKWEKVKPILKFALDKGADVAITFMGLIMQMKLGM